MNDWLYNCDGYTLAGCFLQLVLFTTSLLETETRTGYDWPQLHCLLSTMLQYKVATTDFSGGTGIGMPAMMTTTVPSVPTVEGSSLSGVLLTTGSHFHHQIIQSFTLPCDYFQKSIEIYLYKSPQTGVFHMVPRSTCPMCTKKFWGPNASCASCAAKCQGGQMLRLKVSQDFTRVDMVDSGCSFFSIRRIFD